MVTAADRGAPERRLLLHGAWVAAAGGFPERFALWGECSPDEAPLGAAGAVSSPGAGAWPPYPGAAGVERLQAALAVAGAGVEVQPWSLVLSLPPGAAGSGPSGRSAGGEVGGGPGGRDGGGRWLVPAVCFDAAGAAGVLLAIARAAPDLAPDIALDVAPAGDLRCWIAAAQFGLDLVRRQRFVPAVERDARRGVYVARWRPLFDQQRDQERLDALTWALPAAAGALAWERPGADPGRAEPVPDAPQLDAPLPAVALRAFLRALVDGVVRAALPAPDVLLGGAAGVPPAARAWLAALTGDPVLRGDAETLAALERGGRAWLAPAPAAAAGPGSFRVCFRLEPPAAGAAPGQPPAAWTLRYLLQGTDDPSLLLPAALVWQEAGDTLRLLDRALREPQEHVLRALGSAGRVFPPIAASLAGARPERCALALDEAYAFVRDAAPRLEAMGFGVLVPRVQAGLSLRGRLRPAAEPASPPSRFGVLSQQTLVRYDWRLALGGEELTQDEFEALAQLKEPLVRLRGRWMELRPEEVGQALAFFEREPASGELSLAQALSLALTGPAFEREAAPGGGAAGAHLDAAVSAEGWLADVLRQLGDHGGREAQTVDDPPGFAGRLRPYQQSGVAWLAALRRIGLGACLADDMGLGKTPTLIALLLHQRRDALSGAALPALVVCPTSVVENWRRELARFAPSLRVLVHHGAGRDRAGFAAAARRHDVVISTYALLHRDAAALRAVEWGDVALDEAQNVKNASTQAAQAARSLRAHWRVALTGTPVENRLADLWSIYQFLNPGYLGSAEAFRKRYAAPVERTPDASGPVGDAPAARLRALVAPFLLRRLKTDPAVIRDLPEKHEMRVYCTLTKEQATLYEAVVRDSLRDIAAATGLRRRGRILAALTQLKQVCDHPALFLHDRSALAGRSGKLTRLCEMLEEVEAVGDRALIFTQYAEMGALLKAHLESVFAREVLFLHGGVPAPERQRMVDRFQAPGGGDAAPRLFILSVKAGGTGLNLTAASHVFHFDRWWNPAVENQATDRAFRIGQTRNVQVHKLVCAGTFEEQLDELIERKTALSAAIVGTGETWITELSAEQLRSLFALRPDALDGGGGAKRK